MRKPDDLMLNRYAHTDSAYYDLRVSRQGLASGVAALAELKAADIAERALKNLFRHGRHAIVASLEPSHSAQKHPPQPRAILGCMLVSELNIGPRKLLSPRAPRPVIAAMVIANDADLCRYSRKADSTKSPSGVSLRAEIGLNLAKGLLCCYDADAWIDARSLRNVTDERVRASTEVWKMLGLEDTLTDASGQKQPPTGDISTWYVQNRFQDVMAERTIYIAE